MIKKVIIIICILLQAALFAACDKAEPVRPPETEQEQKDDYDDRMERIPEDNQGTIYF
mgnify:CR=1 FL=1|jgi:hypothetical protein